MTSTASYSSAFKATARYALLATILTSGALQTAALPTPSAVAPFAAIDRRSADGMPPPTTVTQPLNRRSTANMPATHVPNQHRMSMYCIDEYFFCEETCAGTWPAGSPDERERCSTQCLAEWHSCEQQNGRLATPPPAVLDPSEEFVSGDETSLSGGAAVDHLTSPTTTAAAGQQDDPSVEDALVARRATGGDCDTASNSCNAYCERLGPGQVRMNHSCRMQCYRNYSTCASGSA